jgi:DNA-binding LytR/AlgR family response regulator
MIKGPIKILVVEDEMIIAAKISMFLTELGYEVTGIIPRAEEALLHIESNPPNIALLDIQLKGSMNGITLGEVLHQAFQIPVVFLTANADDKTFEEAKKAKPYAFLAKPFKKTDLKRAIELTISLMTDDTSTFRKKVSGDDSTPLVLSDRIFVYHNDKKVKILLDEILYIEADRNYCRIITHEKNYLLTMPMKSLEEELPAALFQRIHRSFIVNLSHVNEFGESIVKVGEKHLTISKTYKKEFLMRIKSV